MTYTEILANFIKLSQVICVSREKRREELIPALFTQESLKNSRVFDSNRDIQDFNSFLAIIRNQKKARMMRLLNNSFYCNYQGKFGEDNEFKVYLVGDKVQDSHITEHAFPMYLNKSLSFSYR